MFMRSTLQPQILRRLSGFSRLISIEEKSQGKYSKISNFIKEFSQPILSLTTILGFIYYLGNTHANLNAEVKILNMSSAAEKEKMEKVSAAEKEIIAAEKREIEAKLETVKSVSEARIRELETQIKYLSSK